MRKSKVRVVAASVLCALPLCSFAAPLVIDPAATLEIPDARYEFITDVAIDGDWLIMTAARVEEPFPGDRQFLQGAFLFNRNTGGEWEYVRLLEDHAGVLDDREVAIRVAMNNGLAAITVPSGIHVYELRSNDWVQVPAQGSSGGYTLEIDAGTILASDGGCGAGATAYRKNTAGVYAAVHTYQALPYFCSDGDQLERGDISGSIVVMHQEDNETFESGYYVWEGVPPGAAPTTIPTGTTVGGDSIAGLRQDGVCYTDVYRRQSQGVWNLRDTLVLPDAMAGDSWTWCPAYLQFERGLLLQGRLGRTSIFQRDSSGSYKYVAKLRGVSRAVVSNNRAAGEGQNVVHVFDLPVTFSAPDLKQDDFQDRNANGWTPNVTSQFGVVATELSYVYRQSSLADGARSIWSAGDWTNQSIQAEIRPTAFADGGDDRWFGVVARYTDDSNYYYITVRRSNVIQIRKIVNGAFQVLASAALPVSLKRTYTLRLEAIGSKLEAYVDGKRMLEVVDTTHTHGRAGVMMYKTRADIDNVVLTSHDRTTLVEDTFDTNAEQRWTEESGSWTASGSVTASYYEQTFTGSIARSITGVATDHQSIQARITPTAFGGTTNAWYGLMARLVDARNYYYVTIRNDNTISLRKLVDDVVYVLDTGSLKVGTGVPYRIRLDAVGNALRVYVNGTMQLEAHDSTFPKGRYGLVTVKTAARFDDLLVTQP